MFNLEHSLQEIREEISQLRREKDYAEMELGKKQRQLLDLTVACNKFFDFRGNTLQELIDLITERTMPDDPSDYWHMNTPEYKTRSDGTT